MKVFLDTSGLIAVVNTDDHWHTRAESVWEELTASPIIHVTSSLVLIELADGLSRVQYRPLALRIVDALQSSKRIKIVQSDASLETRGWQLFRNRSDKAWGMTDCVSMALMADLEIETAFTSDHHFEQAGFNILLK